MADRSAEDLLVHAGWLRTLALRLVRDDDGADDLVQDTWIATMRRVPERTESTKSWLAKVMLNRLRMRARSEGRRTAREQATLLIDDTEVPSQDAGLGADFDYRVLVPTFVRVKPRGPAGTAGFLDGDVVTAVDGVSIANLSVRGVWVLIVNRSAGASAKLTVMRAGQTIASDVTLGPAD